VEVAQKSAASWACSASRDDVFLAHILLCAMSVLATVSALKTDFVSMNFFEKVNHNNKRYSTLIMFTPSSIMEPARVMIFQ
jgi:hypothetical protein